jgi:putative transposase
MPMKGDGIMPRKPRKKSSTGIYHIIMRGVNKQAVFKDNQDCGTFLKMLRESKDTYDFEIFAFCLMGNHVHLLIQEINVSVSIILKAICSSYVYYFNIKYDRCGHLFQERFRSEPVENEQYFMTVLRYILQNPVKAGLVKKAEDYPWSSYRNLFRKRGLISSEEIIKRFSDDRSRAIKLLNDFINLHSNDRCMEHDGFEKPTDEDIQQYIYRLGIEGSIRLCSLEPRARNEIIHSLKCIEGATLRQIERVTGVSRSTISRLWQKENL